MASVNNRFLAFLIVFSLLFFGGFSSLDSLSGQWIKEGEKWYYYNGLDNPVENMWILDNDKWYYVGSKGEMKTGFIKDPESGRKFYLGEDGALVANCFTPDHKYYIGKDGTELEGFDKYRKKVEGALNKAMSIKGRKDEKGKTAHTFFLPDLNQDGYRDIVVGNRTSDPDFFYTVELWDPEAGEFKQLLEMDPAAEDTASFRWDSYTGVLWFVLTDKMYRYDYYYLNQLGESFYHEGHFEAGYDEDEDGDEAEFVFRVNGEKVEYEEYLDQIYKMDERAGTRFVLPFKDLTKENITDEINTLPSVAELEMWEAEEMSLTEKKK